MRKGKYWGLFVCFVVFMSIWIFPKTLLAAIRIRHMDFTLNSNKKMYQYDFGRTSNFSGGPLTFPAQKDFGFSDGGVVVVADQKIYLGSRKKIYVIDATTYNTDWVFDVEQQLNDSIESAIAVARQHSTPLVDYLYFGTHGYVSPGVYKGKIVCLDLTNQQLKWTYQTNGFVQTPPVVYKGIVYMGSSDGNLYAVDAISGQLKWMKYLNGQVWWPDNRPVIANDIVYVASMGGFYALDAQTGQEIWKIGTNPSRYIYYNNTIYLQAIGSIYALDSFTGQIKNQYNATSGYYLSTNLCAYADKIYFIEYRTNTDQQLIALDKDNLTPVLIKALPTTMLSASDLAASKNILYLTAGAYMQTILYGLDSQTGNVLGSITEPGAVFEMPFIYNQKLYLVSYHTGGSNSGFYVYKE